MKEARKYWSENCREVDCLKYLSMDRRLLPKTVSGKQDVRLLADSAG